VCICMCTKQGLPRGPKSFNMSGMKRLNQRGHMNALLIPLVLLGVFFVITAGMAAWAFSGRQDYKNKSDEKVAAAVEVAEQETSTKKDNQFAEEIKQPLTSYKGPEAFGSIFVKYPKTWSAYVNESPAGSGSPVDAYFQPGFVPAVKDNVSYALRIQLMASNYATVVQSFDSNIKSGKLKASPYTPASVSGVVGLRLDGTITTGKNGAMIIVPIRDKTLKVWTESPEFLNDFNNNILPNFTFAQ
jgi:hypothetical protein